MSKHVRNPIRELCVKIVSTHEQRKEHLQRLLEAREDLLIGLSGMGDMDGMPHGNDISDPVSKTYEQIEKIEDVIKDEKRRIEAVEDAISKIGEDRDEAVRAEMKNAILQNVCDGYHVPYASSGYPFNRTYFYDERIKFLNTIARKLNLISRY